MNNSAHGRSLPASRRVLNFLKAYQAWHLLGLDPRVQLRAHSPKELESSTLTVAVHEREDLRMGIIIARGRN